MLSELFELSAERPGACLKSSPIVSPLAKSSSISKSLWFAFMDKYTAVTEYRLEARIEREPSCELMVFRRVAGTWEELELDEALEGGGIASMAVNGAPKRSLARASSDGIGAISRRSGRGQRLGVGAECAQLLERCATHESLACSSPRRGRDNSSVDNEKVGGGVADGLAAICRSVSGLSSALRQCAGRGWSQPPPMGSSHARTKSTAPAVLGSLLRGRRTVVGECAGPGTKRRRTVRCWQWRRNEVNGACACRVSGLRCVSRASTMLSQARTAAPVVVLCAKERQWQRGGVTQ